MSVISRAFINYNHYYIIMYENGVRHRYENRQKRDIKISDSVGLEVRGSGGWKRDTE